MTSPRTLVIFSTSTAPDPYVNVISYCVTRDLAHSVLFIIVDEPGGQSIRATDVQARVTNRLSELSTRAQAHDPTSRGYKMYAAVADKINGAGVRANVIAYDNLFEHLSAWTREGCVIDVTAVDKRLSIEVASILMSLHYRHAYSFRFLRPPTHSDDDLFHNLNPRVDFEYACIVDTPPMLKALARSRRWTLDARLFAGLFLASILFTAAISYVSDAKSLAILNTLASVLGILTGSVVLVRSASR